MKNIRFQLASIYSGGGLGSYGAHLAGGQEIFAVDFNKIAEKVFRQNFPDVPFLNMNALDVTAQKMTSLGIDKTKLRNIDILILSPPCTGISRRNLYRHPFLPVNILLLDCPRLVNEFQPKVAIIENVEGLMDKTMEPLLTLFIARCKSLKNYHFDFRILNANDFNVPQRRMRFVAILTRKEIGVPVFPEPTTKDYKSMYLNRLLPDVIGFDAGGSRKKIINNEGELIGKRSKWIHTNQVCGTITATGEEKFMDIKHGVRNIERKERITICGAEGMKFDGVSDNELMFVCGNGIMPRFMRAICDKMASTYFDK